MMYGVSLAYPKKRQGRILDRMMGVKVVETMTL